MFFNSCLISCRFPSFQIFDAVIVITSFALDLVFIEGITGSQTEEAIALLIIFLLWRILRIVNGKTPFQHPWYQTKCGNVCTYKGETRKLMDIILLVLISNRSKRIDGRITPCSIGLGYNHEHLIDSKMSNRTKN